MLLLTEKYAKIQCTNRTIKTVDDRQSGVSVQVNTRIRKLANIRRAAVAHCNQA